MLFTTIKLTFTHVIINHLNNKNMLVTEKLIELKGQLNYVNEVLDTEIADWERREYEKMKADYESEIKAAEDYIKQHNL